MAFVDDDEGRKTAELEELAIRLTPGNVSARRLMGDDEQRDYSYDLFRVHAPFSDRHTPSIPLPSTAQSDGGGGRRTRQLNVLLSDRPRTHEGWGWNVQREVDAVVKTRLSRSPLFPPPSHSHSHTQPHTSAAAKLSSERGGARRDGKGERERGENGRQHTKKGESKNGDVSYTSTSPRSLLSSPRGGKRGEEGSGSGG
eukprot:CAMPEP_0113889738 /NCGR_PEP_ID=MMETSP0780_2-20120614/13697_1 /TAXON_ID=652834 /ORGANISM="Palpitomonas bilix" /LENGTH=198 /DNA_ID=CAMNT_0000878937 /DNA_START=215 /DNA_END=807 /DNA_ORIENTATION=+ /assembly_acc=CAM_ASM_000599